ncbi:VanZ family protein [Aquisalibacillus elongatus]|uniref:VanZ family protein n=1 Tax=Aquisalibacillus elongatus TaxID=485577 RepID=A0A3N5B9C6_9BACI|nr:VanZ family protein [Aquisalibacillus elongatus]RPF54336.1 VanZ family protein [Aquisalibacillus elongatus]
MRKILWWMPAMVWLGVIFFLSGQPGEDQEIEPLISIYLPVEQIKPFISWIEFTYYGEVRSVAAMGVEPFIEFVFRKLAHFGVYFILAILVYLAMIKTTAIQSFYQMTMSYLLVVHFAILDEVNQGFTDGRTPYFGDVIIDAFGALIGLGLVTLIIQLKKTFT